MRTKVDKFGRFWETKSLTTKFMWQYFLWCIRILI